MTIESILAAPPTLVPGRSANSWSRWQQFALLSVVVVFVSGATFIGIPERTQAERDQFAGPWLALIAATILFWILTIAKYRRAAYSDRAAGYTTTFGDYADVTLLGRGATPVVRLFSTADLWQLDPKTGSVVRPPGDRPRRDRTGFGIL